MGQYFSGFVDQLSADLLGGEFEKQGGLGKAGDLLLYVGLVVGEFVAQGGDQADHLGEVVDDLHAAEDHHGADVQGPLSLSAKALVVHAEGDLIAGPQGIQAVALPTAVEVDTAVLLVIVVVHGGTVGVTSVSYDRQDSAGLGLEKLRAVLGGELLLFAGKVSEHGVSFPTDGRLGESSFVYCIIFRVELQDVFDQERIGIFSKKS